MTLEVQARGSAPRRVHSCGPLPALVQVHENCRSIGRYDLAGGAKSDLLVAADRAGVARLGIDLNAGYDGIFEQHANELPNQTRAEAYIQLFRIGQELIDPAYSRIVLVEPPAFRVALQAVISWALRELTLNRIEAQVHPNNERSIALLTRLGFKEEGRLRQAAYWNNEYQDLLQFSMLSCEWQPVSLLRENSA